MHSMATPAAVFAIVMLATDCDCDCQATSHKEVSHVLGAYRVSWSRSLYHIGISDAHGCHLPRRQTVG